MDNLEKISSSKLFNDLFQESAELEYYFGYCNYSFKYYSVKKINLRIKSRKNRKLTLTNSNNANTILINCWNEKNESSCGVKLNKKIRFENGIKLIHNVNEMFHTKNIKGNKKEDVYFF